MRKTLLAGLAGVLLGAAAIPAMAADIPDLVGTWKGMAKAVYSGATPYRPAEGDGPTFGGEQEYTFVVKEQQDGRFAGETVGKFTETFMGALQPAAYTNGFFIDDDGEYSFTLRDASTMDVCYRHLYPTSRVVSCFTLTKQP